MDWEKGRQGSGYLKKRLFEGESWDLYLLKFPQGSYIDGHLDRVDGKSHRRVNLVLWKAREGGLFWARGRKNKYRRLVAFRPDKEFHGVTKIQRGTRYVLSFGWVSRG